MKSNYIIRGMKQGKDVNEGNNWVIGFLGYIANSDLSYIFELNSEFENPAEVFTATLGLSSGRVAQESYRGSKGEDLLIFEHDFISAVMPTTKGKSSKKPQTFEVIIENSAFYIQSIEPRAKKFLLSEVEKTIVIGNTFDGIIGKNK